jgi:hypothetical protein
METTWCMGRTTERMEEREKQGFYFIWVAEAQVDPRSPLHCSFILLCVSENRIQVDSNAIVQNIAPSHIFATAWDTKKGDREEISVENNEKLHSKGWKKAGYIEITFHWKVKNASPPPPTLKVTL